MEGPTPVSALIHAATLVMLGILLLVKTDTYHSADFLVLLLASSSLCSVLLLAMVSVPQLDMKRITAYTTLTQLGFCLLVCLLCSSIYSCQLLLVHATYKSALFMTLGYLLHATMGVQDLRISSPLTQSTVCLLLLLLASLAVLGVPCSLGWIKEATIDTVCLRSLAIYTWLSLCVLLCVAMLSISLVTLLKLLLVPVRYTPQRLVGEPSDFLLSSLSYTGGICLYLDCPWSDLSSTSWDHLAARSGSPSAARGPSTTPTPTGSC